MGALARILADRVAEAIAQELRPACARLELAGDLRRRRIEVASIDLVAIPRLVEVPGRELFAPPARESVLDQVLRDLEGNGRLIRHPTKLGGDGERYKRRFAPRAGADVNIFVVLEPSDWGATLARRTGPDWWYERQLALCLAGRGWRCEDGGAVFDAKGRPVSCLEEQDFFRCCGVDWVAPERRGTGG